MNRRGFKLRERKPNAQLQFPSSLMGKSCWQFSKGASAQRSEETNKGHNDTELFRKAQQEAGYKGWDIERSIYYPHESIQEAYRRHSDSDVRNTFPNRNPFPRHSHIEDLNGANSSS